MKSILQINVQIDGHHVQMEFDTGAPCSIINKKRLRVIKPGFILRDTDRRFVNYTDHYIECIGSTPVNVTMGTTIRRMNLYTVDCYFDILFGREWITQFAKEINFVDLFSNEIHALLLHHAYLRITKNK